MEYNIIVCCATVRDRDDIGWFVHTAITEQYRCIAYSNRRKNIGVSGGLCVLYIAIAEQHKS